MSEEKNSIVFNTQIAASCFHLDFNYFKEWKKIRNAKVGYSVILDS